MENVTCPFCGLACDDLQVDALGALLEIGAQACPTSLEAYRRLGGGDAAPRIRGQAATLVAAVEHAAAMLRGAANPLFAGMATDLSGARALVQLADRCGGTIDHMNSTAKLRNILAVQDGGWITTTLAEVKNRADLIVCVGTDVVSRFPRFFERCVWNDESMFGLDTKARDIVYLGAGLDTRAGVSPDGREPTVLPCHTAELGEALSALRALLAGTVLQAESIAGVAIAKWRDLLTRARAAKYAVFVWVAPDLHFPHAELAVASLCRLITDLNRETRVCGLPLGGSEGDFTANGVLMWQTGFPLRTSFASGVAEYDPQLNAAQRLIDAHETDALVWVSAYSPHKAAPPTDIATLVLAPPGAQFVREPEVFIPVGTPGVDHAGHMFRADKVVALPLRKLRERGLPSVALVASAIEAALIKVGD